MFQFNYNKKSFDILKKTFDPVYKGEWIGNLDKMNIFYNVYLKEKYKDDLFFIPFVHIVTLPHTFLKKMGKMYQLAVVDAKTKKLFTLINNETIKREELSEFIEKYKKSKKRFHFFDITMQLDVKGEQDLHSVSALYDSRTNQIDFFNTTLGTGLKTYNKKFKLLFEEIYGKGIKLNYSPKCIRFGDLLNECYPDYFTEFTNFYISGPCAVWTLWFLELRLKNKELSRQEVINKALKIFKNKQYQFICETLAGYAQFVDKITSKYKVELDTKNQKALITYTDSEKNKRILKMILATVSLLFINRSFLYKVYKKIEK